MNPHRTLSALLAVSLATVPITALADPRPGAAFPSFSARDLSDRWHNQRELSGRRTLVVALSGPDAGDAAAQWVTAASSRYHGGVRVVTLVALDMPFYAPDGIVRSQARARSAQSRWQHTWLD